MRWFDRRRGATGGAEGAASEVQPSATESRRAARVLVGCGGVLGLCLAVTLGFFANNAYRLHLLDIRRELTGLASVLSEHVDRSTEAVLLVQKAITEDLLGKGAATPSGFRDIARQPGMGAAMRDRMDGLPQIEALVLVDAAGEVVSSTRPDTPQGFSVRERDYFGVLTAPNAPEYVLGAPVRSRITGRWTLYLGRRVAGADGTTLGIVVSALDMGYLLDLYERSGVDPGRAISMIHSDGTLLARFPAMDNRIGTMFDEQALRPDPRGSATGFVRKELGWDGQPRFVATYRSSRFPLVLNVSSTVPRATQAWTEQRNALLVLGLLLEAGLGGMVLVGLKLLRSQAELADAGAARESAARRAGEAALALMAARADAARNRVVRDRRFGMALDNMSQGLCMFDNGSRLQLSNQSMARLFRLPRTAALDGASVGSLLAACVEAHTLSEDQVGWISQRLRSIYAARQDSRFTLRTRDDRLVGFSVHPMEGEDGWILTCEDLTERQRAEQRISHMVQHDLLTNLPNRAFLLKRVTSAMARQRPFALICLDLDRFKTVNDLSGRGAGDEVLIQVSRRLAACVGATDTVARLGSDEFVILHQPPSALMDPAALADRVIQELSRPYDVNGSAVEVGVSAGIAAGPSEVPDAEKMLMNAELALDDAKRGGGGVHRVFHPAMDETLFARRQLETDLRRALSQEEFRLFYQPLVHRQSRAVIAFEALIRWEHPVRGFIPPNDFLPLAEEIGLVGSIGDWVIAEACTEAAGWSSPVKVAVNLSSSQILQGRLLVDTVQAALRRSGLPAHRLELEITETVLLHETDETLKTLHALKELGLSIVMDDFGTGYSSLSYLQKFPFDKVKIDQSFVRGIGKRSDSSAIVHAISGLCSELGVATTVEGVETEQQMAVLANVKCEELQGYLFSPPRPARCVAAMLAGATG